MVVPIALAIAYVALVLVRLVAWRRFSPPRASSVWLFFTPRFFGPGMLLVVAATVMTTRPALGIILAVVGLSYGAIVVRMVRGVAHAAASSTTLEEFANAAVEPSVDYMLTMTVLSVMGLLVLGVVAIIWAVANR
jgi:beta-lactamase regulating signal transducer with metallopeptidase domain